MDEPGAPAAPLGAIAQLGERLDRTQEVGGSSPPSSITNMTIQRMDNVLIVVDDLEAAKAFFAELGMELDGETQVEGPWAGSVVGLDDVRADIAMMRTPDGYGRVELSKFHTPPAVRAEPENAPANALGIRRIMFAVDDIDDVVARLRTRHGAELVGEIA
jgi:catechol 2,3-dioxygenase-like lactoylglutathione lyase family enzyme